MDDLGFCEFAAVSTIGCVQLFLFILVWNFLHGVRDNRHRYVMAAGTAIAGFIAVGTSVGVKCLIDWLAGMAHFFSI